MYIYRKRPKLLFFLNTYCCIYILINQYFSEKKWNAQMQYYQNSFSSYQGISYWSMSECVQRFSLLQRAVMLFSFDVTWDWGASNKLRFEHHTLLLRASFILDALCTLFQILYKIKSKPFFKYVFGQMLKNWDS